MVRYKESDLIGKYAEAVTIVNQKKDILKNVAIYPFIIHAIDQHLTVLKDKGQLLLPNISDNSSTLAIFTDFGGASSDSLYETYTFLFCSYDSLFLLEKEMKKIRQDTGLADKEISFKDFRYGPIKRVLPYYLLKLNNLLVGMVFTIIIDKQLGSVIDNHISKKDLQRLITDKGFGNWDKSVVQKLVVVTHVISYFCSLFAKDGMNIFWMSDNDEIMPNQKRTKNCVDLLTSIIHLYCDYNLKKISYAVPFQERSLLTLDALSCTDIVAGSIEHIFTRKDTLPEDQVIKREETNKVLLWLINQGVSLKKQTIIIRNEGGEIKAGVVEFEAKKSQEIDWTASCLRKVEVGALEA